MHSIAILGMGDVNISVVVRLALLVRLGGEE